MSIREQNTAVAHTALAEIDVRRLSQLVLSAVVVSQARAAQQTGGDSGAGKKQVIFDIDIDGTRYMLIRSMPIDEGSGSLSPREREIVGMVARGQQNKVIAAELNISAWTVCTHLRRIFVKLGVSSRAAMVAKATEIQGLLEGARPVELQRHTLPVNPPRNAPVERNRWMLERSGRHSHMLSIFPSTRT